MLGRCPKRFVECKRIVIIVNVILLMAVVLLNNNGETLQKIHKGYQIFTSWIKNPIDPSRIFGKKCNFYLFWILPVSSSFSFDPEKCQMISSTEEHFQLNLQVIFQEKHFRNETCAPRIAQRRTKPQILTALASYQGSGNTWARHLIEQLTGIQTSSVYCDKGLKQEEFTGECMKTKEMSVVVKTHVEPGVGKRKLAYRKAVLIIRNPFDALIAFYQFRRTPGHVGVVSEEQFKSERWNTKDKGMIDAWKKFNLSWLTKFKHSVYPLLYDNLLHQETFFYELFKLSEFLKVPVTYQTLWCVWVNREGKFHRKNNATIPNITRYNLVQKNQIIEAIMEVNDAFIAKFGYNLPFFQATTVL